MAGSKISQLRQGKPIFKKVDLRGKLFGVVLLSMDTLRNIEEQTQAYVINNQGKTSEASRNYHYEILMAFHCLRDLEDPTLETKAADSVDEISTVLDNEDINRIMNAYSDLLLEKAPKLEMLTEEQLQEIKKHLEVTPLKDLNTVLLVHLTNCHQTIVSNNLRMGN